MKTRLEALLAAILVVCLFAELFSMVSAANTIGANYRNVTVQTRVNITEAKPDIVRIVIDESVNNVANITLSAGSTRAVGCNVTVRDWNGIDGNISVNATFWQNATSTPLAADDNDSHYSNASCTLNAGSPYGQNNAYGNYTCTFGVYFFVANGSWNCTAFVNDYRGNATGHLNYTTNGSNRTTVEPLYALNVTEGIDYGEMAVGEYSTNITANVTNFGNVPINLSVQGYGATLGDNIGLVCDSSVSAYNISIGSEAVSADPTADFATKLALTGAVQALPGFTVIKPNNTNQTLFNTTYWQLYIPPTINPFSNCTGYVVFSATAA